MFLFMYACFIHGFEPNTDTYWPGTRLFVALH